MPATAPTPRLLLVDGHNFAYRAFHAFRGLRSPAGHPTNALYGFIKIFSRLQARADLAGAGCSVVFDGGLDARRLAAWPDYKAQRPPMPADLAAQLPLIQHWLRAAGIASFCQAGVEADDYLASVARRAAAAGVGVVIASSDKDFMQLVSPRIGLLPPGDAAARVWGAAEVRARTGVNPVQIVDWLALMGDAADNIPGVPGVGPKTAAELLNQFGTVEALYRQLGELKSERLRTALAGAEGAVRRNVALVRLAEDWAGEFEPAALAVQPPDVPALRELYGRCGFRSLLAELESVEPVAPAAPAQVAQAAWW